jgi:hypothetical protein
LPRDLRVFDTTERNWNSAELERCQDLKIAQIFEAVTR